MKSALGNASAEWRTILQRLHEFGKLSVEPSDLDVIIGSTDPDIQKAYSSELFRILEARTTGLELGWWSFSTGNSFC